MSRRVVVIGGGAAGMFAALAAARAGASVMILEHNEKLGKKIYITGKGRCNLTNATDRQGLIDHVVRNPKFMFGAFSRWDADDTVSLFEEAGLPLVTERGNRVFPASGHASDVTRTLERLLRAEGVQIRLRTKAVEIRTADSDSRQCFVSVLAENSSSGTEIIEADACIIATGGLSYSTTGSTGDGYVFARGTGHTVTPTSPSLVSAVTTEKWPAELAGLSLRNVGVRFRAGKKEVYHLPVGELLFTHTGVSGPAVLSASAHLTGLMYPEGYPEKAEADVTIHIDLKPAMTGEELDARILRELSANSRKELAHALRSLFPKALIPVVFDLAGLEPKKRADQMTQAERKALIATMKDLTLHAASLGGYNEAVITRGGVSIRQINPSTMESRLVKGLYFAGEVIDTDALTGGFNLQIAWSTGYVAGTAAAACG